MRSRLEKRAVELEQQHGHYAMFVAWREWFVEWNARQPEEIQVDAGTLDETSLFAMCCEFLSGEQEQTYTMSQAIDRIVDGLRLEWARWETSDYVVTESFDGWYLATTHRAYFRRSQECAWSELWEVDGIEENKKYCLADYRTRFRAEIEKAVANHG